MRDGKAAKEAARVATLRGVLGGGFLDDAGAETDPDSSAGRCGDKRDPASVRVSAKALTAKTLHAADHHAIASFVKETLTTSA